jgi:hypothetical protein
MNWLNHRLAEGVRKVGFRKWYERELLSSHAHMVLCLLATIGMIASFEAFRDASLGEKLADVVFVIVCAVIGLWALRRYLYLLMNAENIANQANCPQCNAYGLFTVSSEDRRSGLTRVCCKSCQHEWDIQH